jgi:hypothetical protein
MKRIGHKAMVAYESFEKWRKTAVTKRNLWAQGKVGESSVVYSVEAPLLAASPMGAGIQSKTEPAVKIVGSVQTNTAWIRFQSAAQRNQSQWKEAMHIRAGIEEGILAGKLPLWKRLILRCRERTGAAQEGQHHAQECHNKTTILKMR